MGLGVSGVQGNGFTELAFGLGEKALCQQLMSAVHMELGMGLGVGTGEALLGHRRDIYGQLAERTLVVISAQPFHGNFPACRYDHVLIGTVVEGAQKSLGFGIVFPESQALTKLPGGACTVTVAIELNPEVETVVGIVGIVSHRLLKGLDSQLTVAVIEHYAEVVVDLRQREALGDGIERGFRAGEISLIICGQSEIKISFGGVRVRRRNA